MTEAGMAILNGAYWHFILNQTRPDAERWTEKLGLPCHLLQSLHTVPGEYAEIYVHSPYGGGVARLIVDREALRITAKQRIEDFDGSLEHFLSTERA